MFAFALQTAFFFAFQASSFESRTPNKFVHIKNKVVLGSNLQATSDVRFAYQLPLTRFDSNTKHHFRGILFWGKLVNYCGK